jgi:hypothetical protein
MKMLELFEKLTHNNYNNTFGKVSWCIDGDMMLFQCSKEIEDWKNNFNIIPALLILNHHIIITTRGWKKVWKEIKGIVDAFPEVKNYAGYSCGCIPAQFASIYTGKHADVFASPNIAIMTKRVKRLFKNVNYYQNENDIVTDIPFIFGKGENVFVMKNAYKKPDGVSELEWDTGHSPKQYRLALADLKEM